MNEGVQRDCQFFSWQGGTPFACGCNVATLTETSIRREKPSDRRPAKEEARNSLRDQQESALLHRGACSSVVMGKARRRKTHTVAARAAADSGTAVSTQESQPPSAQANNGNGSGDQMDMKAGVLDGLTSLNPLTRESSCAAIASLFEKIDNPEVGSDPWSAAQRLIAGGLVKKLLPRMVDRAPEVKLQATGAMRNISAVRDPRMCEILVNDDCLTPVLTLLDRMSSTTPPTAASNPEGDGERVGQDAIGKKNQQALVMTSEQEVVVIAQLVATLCNLLAAVDVAVGRFTRQGGLQVVMRLLLAEACRGSPDVFGGALQVCNMQQQQRQRQWHIIVVRL